MPTSGHAPPPHHTHTPGLLLCAKEVIRLLGMCIMGVMTGDPALPHGPREKAPLHGLSHVRLTCDRLPVLLLVLKQQGNILHSHALQLHNTQQQHARLVMNTEPGLGRVGAALLVQSRAYHVTCHVTGCFRYCGTTIYKEYSQRQCWDPAAAATAWLCRQCSW